MGVEIDHRLEKFLMDNKKEILERWLNSIISFYPEGTITFILNEKDRFLNPIGSTISEGISIIFDFLVQGRDKNLATTALESIIKIMAVENTGVTYATSTVLSLKKILKEGYGQEDKHPDGLNDVYKRLDGLGHMAGELYRKCRDDINRIRIKELRARNFRADLMDCRGNNKI